MTQEGSTGILREFGKGQPLGVGKDPVSAVALPSEVLQGPPSTPTAQAVRVRTKGSRYPRLVTTGVLATAAAAGDGTCEFPSN